MKVYTDSEFLEIFRELSPEEFRALKLASIGGVHTNGVHLASYVAVHTINTLKELGLLMDDDERGIDSKMRRWYILTKLGALLFGLKDFE